MSVGQQVEASDIEPDGHETQPPAATPRPRWSRRWKPRRSVAVHLREHYLHNHGSRLRIRAWPCADPQLVAFSVTKLLETNFPKLVDYQFTAEMENGLDRIAHGEESGRDWLTHFYFGSGEGAARNADEAHEGLQQQVAQLGEIDARAINTIDIGDGCTCASAVTAVSGRHGASGRRRQPEARVSAGHHRAG